MQLLRHKLRKYINLVISRYVHVLPANISCFPRRLEDVFSIIIFCLPRRLEDVFKMPSRRICNAPSKNVFKTSSRRLQDVFARRLLQDVFKKMSCNCLEDVLEHKKIVTLKTSPVRLLQDECL